MPDPLAGKREAISEGRIYELAWPDTKCPVEVGDVFPLRSCSIEITRIERFRQKGEFWWRAEFNRYRKAVKPKFLDRRGGTTEDPATAMSAFDDPEPGTIRVFADDERDPVAASQHEALGEAPEPEAIPYQDVENSPFFRESHQRHQLEVAEERAAAAAKPLEQRVARLREVQATTQADISSELRMVEKQVAKAERKVLGRAA